MNVWPELSGVTGFEVTVRRPDYDPGSVVLPGLWLGDWEYVLMVPGEEYFACGRCGARYAAEAMTLDDACACGGLMVAVREWLEIAPGGLDEAEFDG